MRTKKLPDIKANATTLLGQMAQLTGDALTASLMQEPAPAAPVSKVKTEIRAKCSFDSIAVVGDIDSDEEPVKAILGWQPSL